MRIIQTTNINQTGMNTAHNIQLNSRNPGHKKSHYRKMIMVFWSILCSAKPTRQVPPQLLGVVFGVHLSARSRLTGIDPDTSGQSATAHSSVRCGQL